MVFMLVNWLVTRQECERKLDLLKIWRVQVCDCCYDGGYKTPAPNFWTAQDRSEFKRRCRKHNQMVRFGYDPEPNIKP